ncbi:MAG: CDGSH iron-sulfur domain-containing protein [Sulfuricella sp.]|nr:CDGSH iron-sulfur domain-containing protein [Sulfuricella sp.]
MYSRNTPYEVPVKAGDTVYVCRCGKSANPPFCDGSHQKLDTGETPLAHNAAGDGAIYVCGCGKTGSSPFCDGSHK